MSEPKDARDQKLLEDLWRALNGIPGLHTRRLELLAAYREELRREYAEHCGCVSCLPLREMRESNAAGRSELERLRAEVAHLRSEWPFVELSDAKEACERAEAEVERLRSLDDKSSCPATEREGYEGLVSALSAECVELKAEVERLKAENDNLDTALTLARDAAVRRKARYEKAEAEVARLEGELAERVNDIRMITAPIEVGGGREAYLRAEVERLKRVLAETVTVRNERWERAKKAEAEGGE